MTEKEYYLWLKQIFINGVSMQVLQLFFAKIYIAAFFFGCCNSILTKYIVQIMKMQAAKKN